MRRVSDRLSDRALPGEALKCLIVTRLRSTWSAGLQEADTPELPGPHRMWLPAAADCEFRKPVMT